MLENVSEKVRMQLEILEKWDSIVEMMTFLQENLMIVFNRIKIIAEKAVEYIAQIEQLDKIQREKRKRHKLSLNRVKIKDQVQDKRPKFVVRKVLCC